MGLQPYVMEAATVCNRGCNPMYLSRKCESLPMVRRVCALRLRSPPSSSSSRPIARDSSSSCASKMAR
eukprot:scaffold117617_cov18-Phaeocystis_antarctica.AAC.1